MDRRDTPDYADDIEVRTDTDQWENEGADEEDYRITDAAEYIDQYGEDYGVQEQETDTLQEKPQETPRPQLRRTVVGKRAEQGSHIDGGRPQGAYGESVLDDGRRRPRGRYMEPGNAADRRRDSRYREEEGRSPRERRMREDAGNTREHRNEGRRAAGQESGREGRYRESGYREDRYREEEYREDTRRRRNNRYEESGRPPRERRPAPRRDERENRNPREEEEEMASRKKPSKKGKKKEKSLFSERVIKLVGGLIGVIIVLLVVFVVFGDGILESIGLGGTRTDSEGLVSDTGVLNILLIGQDGRDEEGVSGSRSDSMMIVSVDKGTDKVKMISLMRDMYVSIPGYEDNRINAAYSYGGVDLLKETIEENFKVKIDGNVQIDFESFKEIVDKLGGVEIDLSQEEADYLNTAYWQNGWTLTAGIQTLDGDQALAYSRVRQVGNSDFERTERQKKVLMSAFRKVKSQGIISMLSLAKDIYPMLDTDIGIGDMISLGTTAMGMEESDIESYRLPADGMYENQTIRGMQVLVPDLEANREYLYELLFGEDASTEENETEDGSSGQ